MNDSLASYLIGMLMRSKAAIILFACVSPAIAKGHGFAWHVSTPITPPQEYVWWLPYSIAILVVGVFGIYRFGVGNRWYWSAIQAVGAVAAFSAIFFFFGRFVASSTTAPPPGLGIPHRTFWGIGWGEAGWLFIRWNIYGCVFLLVALFVFGGFRKVGKRYGRVMVAALVVYGVGVVPYCKDAALVHGWCGGYVHNGCFERMKALYSALVGYAEAHDDRLPVADNMADLLVQLEPYVDVERLSYGVPIDVCPVVAAYHREPEHYKWNAEYSGAYLGDIDLGSLMGPLAPLTCSEHPVMWMSVDPLVERVYELE